MNLTARDLAFLDAFPSATCILDADGLVVAHNARFFDWVRPKNGSARGTGRPLHEVLDAAEPEAVAAARTRACATGSAVELAGVTREPAVGHWQAVVTPLPQTAGLPGACLFTIWDVTDRVAAQQEARALAAVTKTANERLAVAALEARAAADRAEEARDDAARRAAELDAVFGALADAVLVYAADGRVRIANPAARRLFGFDPVGFDYRELFARLALRLPDGSALRGDAPVELALRGQVATAEPAAFTASDGGRRIVQRVAAPLRSPDTSWGAVAVWRDVTEREQMLLTLEQTTAALREADRKKDEFLAMLGHELRNPLAAIAFASQVLQRAQLPVERRAHFLGTIDRQTQQLVRMVDDLLDVSRITRGRVELRRQVLDLGAVARRAAEAARPTMEARRHRFVVDAPAEPLLVDGDPARLEQVVGNLLGNSAKYTDPGGAVTLQLTHDQGSAVLRVRDTGVGISADMLPRVFDLFAQADTTLARTQGGLGIGLTLVRTLVEMHGGSVSVHSAGPGTGSEFAVHLPLLQESRAGVPEPAAAATAAPGAPAAGAEPTAGRRVLVVEDNADVADALVEVLRDLGHTVAVAGTGGEGVARALAEPPDIMLVDIGLPDIDGYEVVRRLAPLRERTRFVALTGYGQPQDRRRAEAAGFHLHLSKPVDIDRLERALGAATA